MNRYFIYIEYKNGFASEDYANGCKELLKKLKDIHGYKDYEQIDVHKIIENEFGELEYHLTNYK